MIDEKKVAPVTSRTYLSQGDIDSVFANERTHALELRCGASEISLRFVPWSTQYRRSLFFRVSTAAQAEALLPEILEALGSDEVAATNVYLSSSRSRSSARGLPIGLREALDIQEDAYILEIALDSNPGSVTGSSSSPSQLVRREKNEQTQSLRDSILRLDQKLPVTIVPTENWVEQDTYGGHVDLAERTIPVFSRGQSTEVDVYQEIRTGFSKVGYQRPSGSGTAGNVEFSGTFKLGDRVYGVHFELDDHRLHVKVPFNNVYELAELRKAIGDLNSGLRILFDEAHHVPLVDLWGFGKGYDGYFHASVYVEFDGFLKPGADFLRRFHRNHALELVKVVAPQFEYRAGERLVGRASQLKGEPVVGTDLTSKGIYFNDLPWANQVSGELGGTLSQFRWSKIDTGQTSGWKGTKIVGENIIWLAVSSEGEGWVAQLGGETAVGRDIESDAVLKLVRESEMEQIGVFYMSSIYEVKTAARAFRPGILNHGQILRTRIEQLEHALEQAVDETAMRPVMIRVD